MTRPIMTNTNSIRILIANNDDTALSLATTLENHGADVSYASCDPLQIQFEVLRSQPDVLVLPSITRHTEKLCKLLKSCEHAPYIVLLSEDGIASEAVRYAGCADLFLSEKDDMLAQKLCARIFGGCSAPIRTDGDRHLEEAIAQALFELCITRVYNGYFYLSEAIMLAVKSDILTRFISKDIYPEVAAKFGVTSCSVERNIRTAIHSAWPRISVAVKRRYFGTFAHDGEWTPTNSNFIYIIAERIIRDQSMYA